MTRSKEDGLDDQLVPKESEGEGPQRWALRAGVGVVGLLVMATAAIGLHTMILRYPASRFWTTSPGTKVNVGVLLTDSPLDEDMLRAALKATKDHYDTSSDLKDVSLLKAQPNHSAFGVIDAYESLRKAGVIIFLVGGEDDEILTALCKHIDISGHNSVLISPEAGIPRDSCPSLITLSPGHEAIIVAEVGRLAETKVEHIIPVVMPSEADQVEHVAEAAKSQNISVTPEVLVDPQDISWVQLRETLTKYPGAAVWMSLGSDLSHLFPEVSRLVCSRLVLIHAHPSHRAELLLHTRAREAAEKCGVCTAAWLGSSSLDSATRRRVLDEIHPQDPFMAILTYDITSLTLNALSASHGATSDAMKIQLLHYAVNKRVYESSKHGLGKIGWVARLRLVAQRLLGWAVLQDTPWLLEGNTQVIGGNGVPWVIVAETHAPTHMVTQEEVMEIASRGHCNTSARVEVTAHDPLTHQVVTTSWSPSEAPPLLLIPNGSPNGFAIKVWCRKRHRIPSIEVGCQGAKTHNEAVVCAFATLDRGRRVVRSILTSHVFPFRRQQERRRNQYGHRRQGYYQYYPQPSNPQQYYYQEYQPQHQVDQQYQHQNTQENENQDNEQHEQQSYQQEEPEMQQYQQQEMQMEDKPRRPTGGGPFSKAFKKLKAYLKSEDFKGMIPQIGGCLGATGGCTFCFTFLLYNDVAISPGVCFGACSVAVGGSCTTLLAKGLQYHLDHTVICTELFNQGHLSIGSYLADAAFGTRLAASNPQGLRGYQILATPIVTAMQVSPSVSAVVEAISQPWIRHMEYEEGLRTTDDTVGSIMTTLGLPLCSLIAVAIDNADAILILSMTAALWRRART